jgi:hypothetical protein
MEARDPATGRALDTIPAPTWDYQPPLLVARRPTEDGVSRKTADVPFSPEAHWAFSPLGYMVGGLATRYAIDQYHLDGTVLRIERTAEPVPVRPAEAADMEARVRWGMRRHQSDWSWDGPAIPATKPPFRGIFVGKRGRMWVLLHQPAERIPDAEIVPPSDDRPNPPPIRWREPIAFDVFEPDGTYLGMVRAPDGFATRPAPVFDDDRVWAVVRGRFDVPRLIRFRIRTAGRTCQAQQETGGTP